MPLHTPAREIVGIIKDYSAKEHPRFSIPPPLSPASGGILGLRLKNRCLRFFLGWYFSLPSPREGSGMGAERKVTFWKNGAKIMTKPDFWR